MEVLFVDFKVFTLHVAGNFFVASSKTVGQRGGQIGFFQICFFEAATKRFGNLGLELLVVVPVHRWAYQSWVK